jgi:hypothetical protein
MPEEVQREDRKLRPVYLLRVRAEPGRHSLHALRAVLKALLRRHGLRCIELREEAPWRQTGPPAIFPRSGPLADHASARASRASRKRAA